MYSFKNIFIEAYMKINTKLNFCIKLTKHNVFLRWCIILLKSESLAFQKKLSYLLGRKPFKNDEKYFLFHLKSSFSSEDILVFVTTFWSSRKNG